MSRVRQTEQQQAKRQLPLGAASNEKSTDAMKGGRNAKKKN